MEEAIAKYKQQSTAFRSGLQQARTANSAGNSLANQVRLRNGHIVTNAAKHICGGRLILGSPSRSQHSDTHELGQDNMSEESSEEIEVEEDSNPNEIDADDEGVQRALAGQGAMVIGDKTILVHKYLGERADKVITKLHDVQPIEYVPGLSTPLWRYQEKGIAKILECWKGRYKSCFLTDAMGLGKTIQAIAAALLDRDQDQTPACFSLVVTTKTCVRQWADQMIQHFDEDCRPSYKILDSSRTTARELMEGNYDFVICSYGFIQAQHRDMRAYEAFFENVKLKGQAHAERSTALRKRKRRKLSLFSELYSILQLPIRHLILDEAQNVKNWDTATHQAIRALDYRKLLVSTGTPISNRWWDIYGLILFMKENPFLKFTEFLRTFGNIYQLREEPPASKLPRLIKFLMEVTVSRPASMLNLPEVRRISKEFTLDPTEFNKVLFHTKLFIDALKQANMNVADANFRTNSKSQHAITLATRAQQHAAHPDLIGQAMPAPLVSQLQTMPSLMAMAIGSVQAPSDPRAMARAVVDYLQQQPKSKDKIKPAKADQEDDPNKALDAGDDDEEEDDDDVVASEKDEEESNAAKRKRWLHKVKEMPDERLRSSRVDAIYDVLYFLRSKNPDERIVIFSRFVKFLDIIAQVLKRRAKIIPLRLDGGSTKDARLLTTKIFGSTKGSVLLITPRTGGVGLNGLQCASKLIQCEPWWTSAEEAQALSRLFRPGQNENVEVYYMDGLDCTIDVVIEKSRNAKEVVNEKIIGPLRRRDDEPLQIPEILPW